MNADQSHFVLSKENEDERKNDFLKELIERKQQYEIEQQRLREEQERIRAAEERMKQEEEKQRARLKCEEEGLKQRQRAKELEDEQIEKAMQETIRRAALRPIEVDPDHWNYQNQRRYQYDRFTYQTPPVFNKENTKDKTDKQKKERLLEQLLSHPITGELYIDGDKKYWRRIILKWIKENQSGVDLFVSSQKLIGYMKTAGVSFNQNDQRAKYPIKIFLEFYVKTMKAELKKKIEITIKE